MHRDKTSATRREHQSTRERYEIKRVRVAASGAGRGPSQPETSRRDFRNKAVLSVERARCTLQKFGFLPRPSEARWFMSFVRVPVCTQSTTMRVSLYAVP